MDNTACGENCPYVQSGFCKSDKECPHYTESWWIEGSTQQQKLLKDCAPKRLILQSNYHDHRIEGLQISIVEQRNAFNEMITQLCIVADRLKALQDHVEDKLGMIEEKKEKYLECGIQEEKEGGHE